MNTGWRYIFLRDGNFNINVGIEDDEDEDEEGS